MMTRVIVALDRPTYADAVNLAAMLDPNLCRLKVGKELFTAAGPAVVESLMKRGYDVFLDLKFHDIPNTVAGAIRSACGLGVWMVNVHASGGQAMMEAAVNAIKTVKNPPILIGVTLLTSLGKKDLEHTCIFVDEKRVVLSLATLAKNSGLDGVVCSGHEAETLRERFGEDFTLVTPGIRLPEGSADDQARIMTPEKAIISGANYLVVGRPITSAPDPLAALQEFNQRVSSALCG